MFCLPAAAPVQGNWQTNRAPASAVLKSTVPFTANALGADFVYDPKLGAVRDAMHASGWWQNWSAEQLKARLVTCTLRSRFFLVSCST